MADLELDELKVCGIDGCEFAVERGEGRTMALHKSEDHPVSVSQERDLRGISNCWQHLDHGWHVYGAGPCFDTYEQAITYRDALDRDGITWRPQPR